MEANGRVPVEIDPLFGFRAQRRKVTAHPEHHVKTSVVPVGDEDLDSINYQIQTFSLPGFDDRTEYEFFAEWIDRNGRGHQVHLPAPVVAKLIDHHSRLKGEAMSRRSKRGAETRKSKRKTATAK